MNPHKIYHSNEFAQSSTFCTTFFAIFVLFNVIFILHCRNENLCVKVCNSPNFLHMIIYDYDG